MADAADGVLRGVGRRAAELRRAKALTQEQLAEKLRLTVQYLQRVEAGKENLTVRSLVRLAKLLGVHVRELFAPPSSRKAPPGRPRRAVSETD